MDQTRTDKIRKALATTLVLIVISIILAIWLWFRAVALFEGSDRLTAAMVKIAMFEEFDGPSESWTDDQAAEYSRLNDDFKAASAYVSIEGMTTRFMFFGLVFLLIVSLVSGVVAYHETKEKPTE